MRRRNHEEASSLRWYSLQTVVACSRHTSEGRTSEDDIEGIGEKGYEIKKQNANDKDSAPAA